MEITLAGLRVLRETAERGTFTAAAAALGYTQSAVSRQIAGLERAVGTPLFERRPEGPRLTREGRMLERRARSALDEIDEGAREARGSEPGGRVRLGVVPSAGPALLPRALAELRRRRPDLTVTSRIGTTPSLVRGLRAGATDLVLAVSRPPHRPLDGESPPLGLRSLGEQALRVAVPADSALADRDGLDPAELVDQPWIVSPSTGSEPQLGVWPSLPGRPHIAHVAGDWATKLHLVAAGAGITTLAPIIVPAAPTGVRVLAVTSGPMEIRRLVAATRPDDDTAQLRDVLGILEDVAEDLNGAAILGEP